jgi:putative heme-binding domain-containing protein
MTIRAAIVFALLLAAPLRAADPLPALVGLVAESPDPAVQLDVLRGLNAALAGRRNLPAPAGWATVEPRLLASDDAETRALARSLGLAFGSRVALDALRAVVADAQADAGTRRDALAALLGTRDPGLPALLRGLLPDPALRGAALRGLAGFDDPATAPAVLGLLPSLTGADRRDALNTLAARPASARDLLAAVEGGKVARSELSADLIRQLRSLKDAGVNDSLTKVYGAVREVAADKAAEIERYKRLYWAGGSQPGDAIRGRAVYARVCQQCHMLYDVGGQVGPDLTGSNRADLDYLLQNILDPNAVIPNEYQASTVEMKDGRVLTGILREQTDTALTLATANETVQLARADVDTIQRSELSMMPEGLVAPLADQEYRDLIYYLTRPGQVPMLGTPDTAGLFFNGQDLAMWQGTEGLWTVESGEIVGRSAEGLKRNEFLRSDLLLGDFRLVLQVKLTPDSENSGIQFRSEPLPDGEVKGYQADIGAGWWGKLYEEHGRALLWDKSCEPHVKPGEWNTYEILAVGSRIRTALNGHPCVDLDDPAGARRGIIAFQLHSGGPLEVRFKDLRLELDPQPELKTVGR